uniref:hypothetical protein n=1 Tax=Exiguobacterium indicum TaxID=296995 RepID=UPI002B2626FC
TYENVNNLLKTRKSLLEDAAAGTRNVSQANIENAKQEVSVIEKTLTAYKTRAELEKAHAQIQTIADKPQSRFDPEVLALNKY